MAENVKSLPNWFVLQYLSMHSLTYLPF